MIEYRAMYTGLVGHTPFLQVGMLKLSTCIDCISAEMTTPSKMKWTGKVDSKGFRILQDQVLNLEYLSEDVIVKILRDSIIYEDGK